ncbi:MAG: EF-hand domain-containing protein [Pseudomonadota bacterium]
MKCSMFVVTLAFVLPALAHDGMHGPAASFDKDGNGTLSLMEYTAYLQATNEDVLQAQVKFAALDTNGDGKLSSGEIMRSGSKRSPG